MPTRAPGPGEQYRFHFDMGKCIGCQCCVVACNEQNGNPAAINWRRVGEIEGGWYPQAQRFVSLDGLQPLRRSDVPERLPGRRLHEGSGHRHRAAQRGHLHRLPGTARGTVRTACRSTTRSEASSASATCATAGSALGQSPACVSACPSGAIRDRDRQRRRVAGGRARRAPAPGVPVEDRQPLDDAHDAAEELPPNARPVDLDAVAARRAALAAHHHDGAHAALSGRTRDDLAAAAARRLDAPRRAALTSVAGRRPGAGGVDVASRTAGPRLSRDQDVETVVAQPRGAAVHGVLGGRLRLCRGVLLLGLPGDRHRCADRRCWRRRVYRQRLHLSRAVAALHGTRRSRSSSFT